MRITNLEREQARLEFARKAAAWFAANPNGVLFPDGDISTALLLAIRWGANDDCVAVVPLPETDNRVIYEDLIRAALREVAPEPASKPTRLPLPTAQVYEYEAIMAKLAEALRRNHGLVLSADSSERVLGTFNQLLGAAEMTGPELPTLINPLHAEIQSRVRQFSLDKELEERLVNSVVSGINIILCGLNQAGPQRTSSSLRVDLRVALRNTLNWVGTMSTMDRERAIAKFDKLVEQLLGSHEVPQ